MISYIPVSQPFFVESVTASPMCFPKEFIATIESNVNENPEISELESSALTNSREYTLIVPIKQSKFVEISI